jgi:NADH dehydrogenase
MPQPHPPSSLLPHVVIIGGGFGGIATAQALAKAPVRITLVDRRNYHLFQPLLYQVATASLSAPAIAAPLRHMLRDQRNVTVLMDEVEQLDPARRRVALSRGALHYDWLVVASGATHAYFGNDGWAADAPGLKTLDDAFVIRRRMLSAFERAEQEDDPVLRQAWLNFVVIGAGATGVELAGAVAEIARHTLPREFRRANPRSANVLLVEAGARVLPAFDPSLSAKAQRQLEALGVQVLTGQPVTEVDAGGVKVGNTRIPSHTVLWAAGVSASPLGRQLGAPVDRAGRVLVQPDLSLPGYPEVFVIGDLASVQNDGKPVPGVAPAAKQMGHYVAQAIIRRAHGKPNAAAFQYKDGGSLATIGHMAAVAQIGKMKFSGALAWWVWLVAHIFFLIGFRNRMVVLLDWALAYFSYQRHARIVTGQDRPPARPDDL